MEMMKSVQSGPPTETAPTRPVSDLGGRRRTHRTDYIQQLAWEHLRMPQKSQLTSNCCYQGDDDVGDKPSS